MPKGQPTLFQMMNKEKPSPSSSKIGQSTLTGMKPISKAKTTPTTPKPSIWDKVSPVKKVTPESKSCFKMTLSGSKQLPPPPPVHDENSHDFKPEILVQMEGKFKLVCADGDKMRIVAYRNAITSIRLHEGPIYSVYDLNGIKNVGKAFKTKIGELIEEGTIGKLDQ
jgi:hypothetical protein